MTFRSELPRKVVHISMGGFALLLRWMTPWQAILMAVAALMLNALFLHRLTGGRLLRAEERPSGFSGGIVLYPAVLLFVFVVFHARLELAAAVWGLLAVGDGMATLIGLALGPRLPWNGGKTWTGLSAFVLFGWIASAFLIRWTQLARGATVPWPRVEVTWVGSSFLTAGLPATVGLAFLMSSCLAAALAAAVAESVESGVDDNLRVPLVGGATLAAAALISPDILFQAAPALLTGVATGLAITAPLALLAYLTRSVDGPGACAGMLLGAGLYACRGLPGFALLVLMVVAGVGATRLGFRRKAALGIAEERGGRRGAGSALANVGLAVVFSFLAVATPFADLFTLAMAGAFATALFDTTASEVGKAYGSAHRVFGTPGAVRAGTDGAVSVQGTAAGMTAAACLGLLAHLVGLITVPGAVAVVVGAFLGSMLESLISALLVDRTASDKHVLNVMNTAVGAAVAVAFFLSFPG